MMIMDKGELIELISKYKKGTTTAEEAVIVQKYFDFLAKKEAMTQATPAEDMQESKKRIWNIINTQKIHKEEKQKLNWMAVAASVILIVCCTLVILTYSKKEVKILSVTTKAGEVDTIPLPDGSVVILNAMSSVSYPEKFDDDARNIQLKGEGFFKVAKDPQKPFKVSTGRINTVVLGTSFNINYYDTSFASVTVATGKVKVIVGENDRTDVPVLTRNQQIQIDLLQNSSIIKSVDVNKVIGWHSGTMLFDRIELSEVFKILKNHFGTNFIISNQSLNKKMVRGKFSGEPLDEILQSLSYIADFNYSKINDSTIVIDSKK